MSSWYRMSMPPKRAGFVFLLLVFLIDLLAILMWFFLGEWLDAAARTFIFRPVIGLGVGLTVLTAAFLGGMRISRYPVPGSRYELMLMRTPWVPGRRLPLGPWHPVIGDLIPLAVLSLTALCQLALAYALAGPDVLVLSLHKYSVPEACFWLALLPFAAFLVSWLLAGYGVVSFAWKGSIRWPFLIAGICVALFFRGMEEFAVVLWFVFLVAEACLVVWKMKQLLAEMPARFLQPGEVDSLAERLDPVTTSLAPGFMKSVGSDILSLPFPEAVQYGFMAGIWLWAIPDDQIKLATVSGAVAMMALLRVGIYTGCQHSHLGLLARWATGQWIVPAYDRVWLPSLAMIAVSGILLSAGACCSLSVGGIFASIALGFSMVIALGTGNGQKQWSLTAPCVYNVKRVRQKAQLKTLTQENGVSDGS